jgi:hypothetical protein
MNLRKLTTAFAFILFSAAAFAGEGHNHSHDSEPVSRDQAVSIAAKNVRKLAGQGKIDKSWESIKAEKAEQKKFGADTEWVVVFRNKKVADPSRQRLFVFLTLGGDYVAANYTGE